MNNYNHNHNHNHVSPAGVGTAGLLGVALVVLKLMGVIKWPWIWVLSPFWIGFAIFVVILAALIIVALVKESREEKKRRK